MIPKHRLIVHLTGNMLRQIQLGCLQINQLRINRSSRMEFTYFIGENSSDFR